MGWFENQIEERRESDRKMLEDSFYKAVDAVMGDGTFGRIMNDGAAAQSAVDDILKYYHVSPEGHETKDTDNIYDRLDRSLKTSGIMYRTVQLAPGWYRDSYGILLGFLAGEDIPVALIPGRFSGYYYIDPQTNKKVHIGAKTAKRLETEAVCFYRPFPDKKLGLNDIIIYIKNCLSAGDIVILVLAQLAATLIAMMLPRITKILTGPVINGRNIGAIGWISISTLCVMIAMQIMGSIQGMLASRIGTKTDIGVQSAMFMRMLSLPADVFSKYSPGEMCNRLVSVNQLSGIIMQVLMSTALALLSSILYVSQIFGFASSLAAPALVILTLSAGFTAITAWARMKITRQQMKLSAQESGMSYAMITGVQKIKLAGAEKRIFAKWLDLYTRNSRLQYNPPLFLKIDSVIATGITLVGNIVIYFTAARAGIDQSDYFAFTATYAMLSASIATISSAAVPAANIRPILEMASPFLDNLPESSNGGEVVTGIKGGIEMNHISFRYEKDKPYVLDDLSLRISPGEYVAIVGRTGCGKSTLVRLLLGFEKPEKGTIYYDGKDMSNLDTESLRKNIGTVLQDAGLFQGDIFQNIVISAPQLTLDDAWRAAELAGIADNIRSMPMGMNTMISEGSGGLSGGQKQRIMIARAIAPHPKLLLFDEATSALDNRTQRQVSESLESLNCTRIVIAHRLSTIKHCDRILVLDRGRIAEEGNYDELISHGGLFAHLVERQRLTGAK